MRFLEGLDFHEVTMRGQTAKRTVRHYGFDYGYESWQLTPTDPLPEELSALRARAAQLAGVEPEELAEILVSRYPAGAGIGWHRDAPMFGPAIVGVSLGAPAPLRFQRGKVPSGASSSSRSRRARPTCSPVQPGRPGSTASPRRRPCATRSRSAH